MCPRLKPGLYNSLYKWQAFWGNLDGLYRAACSIILRSRRSSAAAGVLHTHILCATALQCRARVLSSHIVTAIQAPGGWATTERPTRVFVEDPLQPRNRNWSLPCPVAAARGRRGWAKKQEGQTCSGCAKSNWWALSRSARRRRSPSAAAGLPASLDPTVAASRTSSTLFPGCWASRATSPCGPSAWPTASSTARLSGRRSGWRKWCFTWKTQSSPRRQDLYWKAAGGSQSRSKRQGTEPAQQQKHATERAESSRRARKARQSPPQGMRRGKKERRGRRGQKPRRASRNRGRGSRRARRKSGQRRNRRRTFVPARWSSGGDSIVPGRASI